MSSDPRKLTFVIFVPILAFLFFSVNHLTKSKTYNDSDYNWNSLWIFDLTDDDPTSHISSYEEIWEAEIRKLKLTSHGKTMAEWLKTTYPEAPYMLHIANCESAGLIHKKDGRLLKRRGGSDAGVLQVNAVHKADIAKKGLNLNKPRDYFIFTRHLFDKKGTQPWYMSKHCWEPHYNRINEILAQI